MTEMAAIAGRETSLDPRVVSPGSASNRLLRSFWQPVFVGDRLPAGKAMPLHILGEDFTLFRGKSGKPQVLAPYCAHRGARLNAGWVEDDCLRCFYHGWKYAADGACVEQPAEGPIPDEKVRVASYPTRESWADLR